MNPPKHESKLLIYYLSTTNKLIIMTINVLIDYNGVAIVLPEYADPYDCIDCNTAEWEVHEIAI